MPVRLLRSVGYLLTSTCPLRPVMGSPAAFTLLGLGWFLAVRVAREHGSVLEQRPVCLHDAPTRITLPCFNTTGRAREGQARSLDGHGPEPETLLRPVLILVDAPDEQFAIKGREVWTAWPSRIRPRLRGEHPGQGRKLRCAHCSPVHTYTSSWSSGPGADDQG